MVLVHATCVRVWPGGTVQLEAGGVDARALEDGVHGTRAAFFFR